MQSLTFAFERPGKLIIPYDGLLDQSLDATFSNNAKT